MNRIADQKPQPAAPCNTISAALVLVGPGVVALLSLGLRLLLHAGHWDAFPWFGVGLGISAGIGVWTSARVSASAAEGSRVLLFLAALSLQVLLAAAAMNLVWWLVPLGVSGP